MSTAQNHIDQWQHNRAFLQTIPMDYADWIVTACFYTALHAVQTLLVSDGITHVVNHETRSRHLAEVNRYKKINTCYRPLYDLSRTARYLARPTKWVPADQIEDNVIKALLYPIENSVIKLANVEIELEPISING